MTTEDFNLETDLPEWLKGDLLDIKEEKDLIPPTQNVLVKIEKIEMNNEKDGIERSWKWLSPTLKIVEGIEVNGETKYNGKLLFGDMICYFADYEVYKKKDSIKNSSRPYSESIKKGQHLIDLKKLCKACNIEGIKPASINGVSDSDAAIICEKAKGQLVSINIGQKQNGDIMENKVLGYSPVASEDLV